MKKLLLGLFLTAGTTSLFAQVGIGTATPNTSAQLEISATNKGLLIPRVAQANRPASPVNGLLIYQTDGTPGFYYYDGTSSTWKLLEVSGNNWSLTGNAGTSSNGKLGTTDNSALNFIVANQQSGFIHYVLDNTSFGFKAGLNGGSGLTAFGFQAAKNNTGSGNTAVGSRTLTSNTSGTFNTAVGQQALSANTTGTRNVGIGYNALLFNTTGGDNLALGANALFSNTTGGYNIGLGTSALHDNTGSHNIGIGTWAMIVHKAGDFNIAIGDNAMGAAHDANTVTDGNDNTAVGNSVLAYNIGDNNSAFGSWSLGTNYSGSCNTAAGYNALLNNVTGSFNTAVGYNAGPSSGAQDLTNTTAIGNDATVSTDNSIVIGNPAVTSIGGYAPWTLLSDIRFKKDVVSEDHGLDFIMLLKPITYHMDIQKLNKFLYGKKADSLFSKASMKEGMAKKEKILYSGFSAQQVEEAAQKIGYNFSGIHKPESDRDHYSLDYASFVVPLVKAVQEQQETIEQLKNENTTLRQKDNSGKEEIENLKQQIKEIAERLNKLEATSQAPKGKAQAQGLH